MTSTEIHLSPLFVLWALRSTVSKFAVTPEPLSVWDTLADFFHFLPLNILFYVIWSLMYSFIIFKVKGPRIATRGYRTMFSHIAFEKGAYDRLPPFWKPTPRLAFLCGHFGGYLVGLVPIPFIMWSFKLHTVFVVAIVVSAVYNGATYYIRVFARDYNKEVEFFEELTTMMGNDRQFLEAVRLERNIRRGRGGGAAVTPPDEDTPMREDDPIPDEGEGGGGMMMDMPMMMDMTIRTQTLKAPKTGDVVVGE
eukprot:GHVO01063020.1.p1 GENE.GHVO01063020.1~~GHVO01063020.1.p1  ORF type:complete len:292 (-),score=40.56 GHVO01063020.1:87-839(-)